MTIEHREALVTQLLEVTDGMERRVDFGQLDDASNIWVYVTVDGVVSAETLSKLVGDATEGFAAPDIEYMMVHVEIYPSIKHGGWAVDFTVQFTASERTRVPMISRRCQVDSAGPVVVH